MALNFPPKPILNDEYTYEGKTWIWNGSAWESDISTSNFLPLSGGTLSGVLTSTVALGTAPFIITSNTVVTNLNADLLDGNHASAFALSSHAHGSITNDGKIGSTANLGVVTGTDGVLETRTLSDSTADAALSNLSTNLITERDVAFGLVRVNNFDQIRSTTIYAPTTGGETNQVLISQGSTAAPTWADIANTLPVGGTDYTFSQVPASPVTSPDIPIVTKVTEDNDVITVTTGLKVSFVNGVLTISTVS